MADDTELREKAREWLIECPEGKHLAFLWANGTIVPHFGGDGLKCPASYTVYKKSAIKTVNPEPAHGWKGRALELEGWLNDAASAAGNCDLDSVGDAIRKLQAEARQEIEGLKEQRDMEAKSAIAYHEKVVELKKQLADAQGPFPNLRAHENRVAASIQEEAQQQIGMVTAIAEQQKDRAKAAERALSSANRVISGFLDSTEKQIRDLNGASVDVVASRLASYQYRAEAAEKQLAEARIELEAAEERGDEYKAALAEARAQAEEWKKAYLREGERRRADETNSIELINKGRAQAEAEIHNRFCGENGEPCQVCRLKAEREEKK